MSDSPEEFNVAIEDTPTARLRRMMVALRGVHQRGVEQMRALLQSQVSDPLVAAQRLREIEKLRSDLVRLEHTIVAISRELELRREEAVSKEILREVAWRRVAIGSVEHGITTIIPEAVAGAIRRYQQRHGKAPEFLVLHPDTHQQLAAQELSSGTSLSTASEYCGCKIVVDPRTPRYVVEVA